MGKARPSDTVTLPPHGPVVFAAALPDYVECRIYWRKHTRYWFRSGGGFCGYFRNADRANKRGWEIADTFRKKGIKVMFGGIATMLHAEETQEHADSVFFGEAEGRMDQVLRILKTATAKGLQTICRISRLLKCRNCPAQYFRPRDVQLPRRADGWSGARIARLPV